MKRTVAWILIAVLVLGMIPATVITAFARGKGVYNSAHDNQSLDQAPGQYIPETIVVDGKLSDTGWPESGFSYVDSTTGYWNSETPDSKYTGVNYKYQIRADYVQLYIGASVTMPENVKTATFTVYFKDTQETSNGYTDKLVFDINLDAENKVSYDFSKWSGVAVTDSEITSAYVSEYSKLDFEPKNEESQTVSFEFRNRISETFSDIKNVTYYVSVDFTDASKRVHSLVHPKVSLDHGVVVPDYDFWPIKNDGTAGGTPVNTTYASDADNLPYAVEVDGKFDEAVWADLTNYTIHGEECYPYKNNSAAEGYISLDGDSLYGTGVKRNVSHFLIKDSSKNFGYYEYQSNDINDRRAHIRFKYELRVDGDYLYGAVVAFVPPINSYNETVKGTDYTVTTSPDLWVMFFDDVRNEKEWDGQTNSNEITDNATFGNTDGARLPESIIQIRSQYSNYIEGDPTYGQIFSTYANCWVNRETDSGNVPAGLGWGQGLVDTHDPEQFEATRSVEQTGDIWNFEFKVALDAVPRINDEIVFSICVADRYGIPGSDTPRSMAFTGACADDSAVYYATYPQYSYELNKDNKITASQISAAKAKSLTVTDNGKFNDGQLDQSLWGALTAADNFVDGREKTSTKTYDNYTNFDQKRFAYKISADYEYIYGAAIVSGNWSADDALKLWIQNPESYLGYSATASQMLTMSSYKVNNGTSRREFFVNTKKNETGGTYSETWGSKLNDGSYAHSSAELGYADRPAWSSMYEAWSNVASLEMDFTLASAQSVSAVKAYFSGGTSGSDPGMYGISVPRDITDVYYSLDGVSWTPIESTCNRVQTYKDTTNNKYYYTPNEPAKSGQTEGYMHEYEYTVVLDYAVTAKYIRIHVNQGYSQHFWCSEVDVYSAVYINDYYTVIMPNDDSRYPYVWYKNPGDINHALPGFANDAAADSTNIYNRDKKRFDSTRLPIDYDGDGNTDAYAFEFRLSWEALGYELDLDAANTEKLFNYYVSVDQTDSGLVHPRNDSGVYPNAASWGSDTGRAFTYGDMIGDIVVDGKLDEKYWAGDAKTTVVMQEVDSVNGTYAAEPTKGNSLSYRYKIYAGEGYLYGAAIIDEEAVFSDNAFVAKNDGHTRFELWIDNNIDENYWTYDDDATTSKETAFVGDGTQESFENYYYTFYLTNDADAERLSNSGGYACGGSTPNWYYDQEKGGEKTDINKSNFNWATTTINGKTYIEFMIDLDNFHCDRSKGFNYYVSAAHEFGNDTADTSDDDELLTLYYPPIETASCNLWVTHYNFDAVNNLPDEYWGILFDSETKYKEQFTRHNWWERAVFAPVGNGIYELKYIKHSEFMVGKPAATEDGSGLLSLESGWIAYALHYDGEHRQIVKDLVNYMNTWEVGDRFVFSGINLGALSTTIGTQVKSGTSGQLLPHAFVISKEGKTRENLEITDSDYRCSYFITSATDKIDIQDDTYAAMLPTATTWDSDNDGSIKQLSHFSPEVVKVDGDLNESAWDNIDWTEVIDSVNGTYQDSLTADKKNSYRFKLRTDDEYLYVAAELDKPYSSEYAPTFRIWLKGNDEANTYTNFYRISYMDGGSTLKLVLPDASYDWAGDKSYVGANENITVDAENKTINYNNLLIFGKNTASDLTKPVGNVVGLYESGIYEESAFYGYTEEIQENMTSGEYYPTINTTKLVFGNQSAVMKSSANDENKTWVEFKVRLKEFGAVDENNNFVGFEYFTQATYFYSGVSEMLCYPIIHTEPDSEYSYYENYMPYWDWSSETAERVTVEDMQSGEIRLRNHCMPVVTLGAKISSSYVAKDGNEYNALRFGALYTEDYLRNWRATDKTTLKPEDANYIEMYTAPRNDYWDVADMGIVMLPTVMLGGNELTLETPDAMALSGDNIVKWIGSKTGDEWSNFADYESFVFYVTLYGVPTDVDVSFRGYVDFYASANTDSFYDHTIVRSYDMIEKITQNDGWIPEYDAE